MPPSLLIHNARIWTATGDFAHAMLIRDGRVVALDDAAKVGGAASADGVIDARGATVTPGLIDAHVHLLLAGRQLSQLDLRHARSREQFEQAIAARHAELPAGQWLIANGWASENWGGDLPDKSWLAAAGDRPAVAYRMDLHVALVNDAVLDMCDLTTDPPGGRIDRDHRGKPTGLMVEAAAWQLVNPLVPEHDIQTKQQCLLAAQSHAHSLGITAVGSMEYARDVADVFKPLRDHLTLRCRITLLDRAWPMDFSGATSTSGTGVPPVQKHASSSTGGTPVPPVLEVIGYKAFIDGTLGSRTARLLADYADDPGNRGMLVELAADGHLRDWAHAVARAGYSPSMHAIGDAAARLALDAIEGIDPTSRPRIEHAQQIDAADLPRFAGVIASMQPLHRADDGRYAASRLGDDRLAGSFAFRNLAIAGAILAFGSDWPVVTCDPIAGIRAAVTGLTLEGEVFQPQQNLTVEEALRAYTTGAAHALQLDDAGELTPGKLGDAVTFDRDPFTADWANKPPRVTTTIVGGEVVYDSARLQ